MSDRDKITDAHRRLRAIVYVRQSSPGQVQNNHESRALQYALRERAIELGWPTGSIAVVDDDLARDFDAFIAARGHQNRSEAVRDLIRARLEAERQGASSGHCVANLSYVYNHHARELAGRLTAEPGVRHGALNLVSVDKTERHTHAPYAAGRQPHVHLKPRY